MMSDASDELMTSLFCFRGPSSRVSKKERGRSLRVFLTFTPGLSPLNVAWDLENRMVQCDTMIRGPRMAVALGIFGALIDVEQPELTNKQIRTLSSTQQHQSRGFGGVLISAGP